MKIYEWNGREWAVLGHTRKSAWRSTRRMLEQLPVAVMATDAQLHIVAWNRQTFRLTGLPAAEVMGKHCATVFHCELDAQGRCQDRCGLSAAVGMAAQNQEAARWGERREITLSAPRCDKIPLEVVADQMVARDGNVSGGLMVLRERHHEVPAAAPMVVADQLSKARDFQERMMKLATPQITFGDDTAVTFAAYNRPSLEVGGDFFQVIPAGPDRIYAVIGDVTGKGICAALVASMACGLFEEAVQFVEAPAAIMESVSDHLTACVGADLFVTALLVLLDLRAGTYRLARAGHEPALLVQGRCRAVPSYSDLPLGIEPHQQFRETVVPMLPGDRMLLYTDGVVESATANALSRGRLRLVLRSKPTRNAEEVRRLVLSLLPPDNRPSRDDISFLAVAVDSRS